MRILLVVSHSMGERPENMGAQIDGFDPSFSQRYIRFGFEWNDQKFYTLDGERHYEADKYHIFYLDIEDEKEADLISFLKEKPWCEMVARADEEFCMVGNPLYKSDGFYERIPQNIVERPASFVPREIPPQEPSSQEIPPVTRVPKL